MSLPPSGYPKIRGKACGADWTVPTVVTGLLPGTGFGAQFKHTVQPVTNNYPLIINLGDDREEQDEYADQIMDRIESVRALMDQHLIMDPLRLGPDHREQIEWLLTHAEAELEAATQIWDKWADRPGGSFPLSLGDNYTDFMGGVCGNGNRAGEWYDPPGRVGAVLCPSLGEVVQRPKDRKAIGQRYFDALAHVYCAEYGYWKLHLYKKAYEAYKERPNSGIGGFQIDTGAPKPQFPTAGDLKDNRPPIDPCKELGIGCPPGEEPEGCPSGFCPPEPEDLPDPGEVPELDGLGEGEPPVIEPDGPQIPVPADSGALKPWHLLAGGATVLAATGIAVGVMSARR